MGGRVALNGLLYGTTSSGGLYGTVFSVDPQSGKENILHIFGGGSDGETPEAGSFIAKNGILYGTTPWGGGAGCGTGCGTVFDIDPHSGIERVIYRFNGRLSLKNGKGFYPEALITTSNELFGAANAGGFGCPFSGCGTMFEVPVP